MNVAFYCKIEPTKEQKDFFAKCFGCTRFIYNKMLSDRNAYYQKTGKTLKPTPAQYKDEFPWLREVDSLALANAQQDLERAFKNFFEQPKIKYPKFKKKGKSRDSYTTNLQIPKGGQPTIRLNGNSLHLPKIKGDVKIRIHRAIPKDYKIKSVTISKDKTDKYYASILFEFDSEIESLNPETLKLDNIIGLDYMMNGLYMTDSGCEGDYPRHYRRNEADLAKAQRRMSRKKEGSKNREKAKKKVAKIHKKSANQRKDFLHKKSREIANSYDVVCVEDLNMKDMAQALHFGKSVHDNGWGMFTTFLKYKLEAQGKYFVKVDKWYPSTQLCSDCGNKKKMPLGEKIYACPCGLTLPRDLNAAINIKNEGFRVLKELLSA